MKKYDDQIKIWASQKYKVPIAEIHSVAMDQHFSEGYACCGGTDPDCYCSFAESASMDLIIEVFGFKPNGKKGTRIKYDRIDLMYGNMNSLIQEIFEAKPYGKRQPGPLPAHQ